MAASLAGHADTHDALPSARAPTRHARLRALDAQLRSEPPEVALYAHLATVKTLLSGPAPDPAILGRHLATVEQALPRLATNERGFVQGQLLMQRARWAAARHDHKAVLDLTARALEHAGPGPRRERGIDVPTIKRQRALAFEALGRPGEATALYADLLLTDAAGLSRWVEAHRPSAFQALDGPKWTARIHALLAVSRRRRARHEALKAPRDRLRPEERVALEVQTVRALALADETGEAIERAERAAVELAPTKADVFALRRIRVWALGKANLLRAAEDGWAKLVDVAPEHARSEACFMAGFSAYEAERFGDARAHWAGCAELLKTSEYASAAAWYRALTFLLEGRMASAEGALAALRMAHPDDPERTKHLYWHAHTLDSIGQPDRARALLARLSRRHPTSYYGILARARLGLPPVRGAVVTADALARRAPHHQKAERVVRLHALGYDEAARVALLDVTPRADRIALSHRVGHPHLAFRHGAQERPYPPVLRGRLRAAAGWRASFAQPYDKAVAQAAAHHGVAPSLVYAIMRTESGFLPTARSAVGARGLLQLMPYTAHGLLNVCDQVAFDDADDLFDPAINIDLGACFIALSRRELGSDMLAIAAYNAGPEHVGPWARAYAGLDPALFIERIPFRETRDYVKKVLTAQAIYRALDGKPLEIHLGTAPVRAPQGSVTSFPRAVEDLRPTPHPP